MTGFPAAAYGRGAYGGEKWLQSMQPMRAAQGERQKSCREIQSVCTVGQSGGCGTVESGEFRDFDSFLCTRSRFCGLIGLKLYCIS